MELQKIGHQKVQELYNARSTRNELEQELIFLKYRFDSLPGLLPNKPPVGAGAAPKAGAAAGWPKAGAADLQRETKHNISLMK